MFNALGPSRGRQRTSPQITVGALVVIGLAVALPTRASAGQAITSSGHATAVVGSTFSFPVTTSGTPVPSIKKRGRLPRGLTLTDNHNGTALISGTPVATTRGVYPRLTGGVYDSTIVATYGAGPTKQIVTQAFTLTLDQTPTITSHSTRNAGVGAFFSFVVKTRGFPNATISTSGALPSGITLANNGGGRATLAGTPGNASAGTYSITIMASNGVGSPATQSFTLTVRA